MTPPKAVRLTAWILVFAPLLAGCDPSVPFSLGGASAPPPAAHEASAAPLAASSSPATAPTLGMVGSIPADSDALVESLIKAVNTEREKVGLLALNSSQDIHAPIPFRALIVGDCSLLEKCQVVVRLRHTGSAMPNSCDHIYSLLRFPLKACPTMLAIHLPSHAIQATEL